MSDSHSPAHMSTAISSATPPKITNLLELMLAFPAEIRLEIYRHTTTDSTIRTVHWPQQQDDGDEGKIIPPVKDELIAALPLSYIGLLSVHPLIYNELTDFLLQPISQMEGKLGNLENSTIVIIHSMGGSDGQCYRVWSSKYCSPLRPDLEVDLISTVEFLALHKPDQWAEKALCYHLGLGCNSKARSKDGGWQVERDFAGLEDQFNVIRRMVDDEWRAMMMVCRVRTWAKVEEKGVLDHDVDILLDVW